MRPGLTNLINGGADGIALVIQNSSDFELGGGGWGIGYMGIPRSLAIEFDTWQNSEANDNHVSIQSLGLLPNSPESVATIAQNTLIPYLSDGQIHVVKIAYVMPGELLVFLDDLSSPVLAVPVDFTSLLQLTDGTAWVGFTSATGAAYENHDILNWSFTTGSVLTKPDLTASMVVSPVVLHVGDTATVSGTVDNGSDVDAQACQLTINFDGQTEIVDLPAIPANGSAPFRADFVLAVAGLQVAEAITDSGNVVAESNEDNNITYTPVIVLPPLRPDLVINSLNAFKQKGKAVIEVGVGNIGTAPAGYFGLRLEVLETGEQATTSFNSLANGMSVTKSFTLKKTPRGAMTFRVTVDPDSLVVELDETNNLLVVSKQI